MATISRQALVAYPCEQMYALVSDIPAYQTFLPWCDRSVIDADDGERVQATLHLKHKGVGMSFTTLNHGRPPHALEMLLVEGPFRHFEGRWSFMPLGDEGCKVGFELDFDFSNRVYEGLFKPILNRAASSLVDAFVERARSLYDCEGRT